MREIVGGQTPIKLLDEENAALENAKSKLKEDWKQWPPRMITNLCFSDSLYL